MATGIFDWCLISDTRVVDKYSRVYERFIPFVMKVSPKSPWFCDEEILG